MEWIIALIIPVVAIFGVFSFLSIAAWSDARRKEREEFYRSETLKKLADVPGTGAAAVMEYLREEERTKARRAFEGVRLGGLVTTAVGLALIVVGPGTAWFIGAIPLSVGVALLVHTWLVRPKGG